MAGPVTVGPLTVENPDISFREGGDQSVGTVGVKLLERFALTLDPSQRRIKLELPAGEE